MTSVCSLSSERAYRPTSRSVIVMRYSPSAKKLCVKRTPPRVPSGMPST